MKDTSFVDHYEILQLSPNADLETIHRVFRVLAQRYHPDNPESGNSELFAQAMDAYQLLSDPARRAAYDVRHREAVQLQWKVFDQPETAVGKDGERRKRQGILSMLYRKRMAEPESASVGLREMEVLLGIPKEHLEFSLWYLKENHLVQRADNARYQITVKGVDVAEEAIEELGAKIYLLPAARQSAGVA
ncbi:MAG: DnaJ domain-containing protein [Bryobacteraceae bacterium]